MLDQISVGDLAQNYSGGYNVMRPAQLRLHSILCQ